MHDGGGDQSQLIEALATALETLCGQGCVLQVVCQQPGTG